MRVLNLPGVARTALVARRLQIDRSSNVLVSARHGDPLAHGTSRSAPSQEPTTGLRRVHLNWSRQSATHFLGSGQDTIDSITKDLLARGRRQSMAASYNAKWEQFDRFCSRQGLRTIPAKTATVCRYVGWLFQQHRVASGSLQPYLTAINAHHEDTGYPKPALGHALALIRKGYAAREHEERGAAPVKHTPILPEVMRVFLRLGLATASRETRRASTALVIGYCFFQRADTGEKTLRRDIQLTERGIEVRENAKNVPIRQPALFTIPRPKAYSVSPHALLERYLLLTADASLDTPLWQLSGEKTPPASAAWGKWLTTLLKVADIEPPLGARWTKHSLRSGGASAAIMIGVPELIIRQWGAWAALSSLTPYVDALFQGNRDDAMFFFGHLRPGP
jgi:hypothetical protein